MWIRVLLLVPIEEKMVKSRLRWFGHVRRRSIEALLGRIDQIEEIPIIRGRRRPIKTLSATNRKDLDLNGLPEDLVFDIT